VLAVIEDQQQVAAAQEFDQRLLTETSASARTPSGSATAWATSVGSASCASSISQTPSR
jgi:hypothetical protein